jgi:hypothetical protein
MANDKSSLKCSFCHKTQQEVKKIIAGSGVYICDECIAVCVDIIGCEDGIRASFFGERRLRDYRQIPLAKLVALLPDTASVTDLIEILPNFGNEAKLREELGALRRKMEGRADEKYRLDREIATLDEEEGKILVLLQALDTQKSPSG